MLEARVIPVGIQLGTSGVGGPRGGRRWVICVCTHWDNSGRAWEQAGLGTPPASPPSLPPRWQGFFFSKEQQGRCQIQKEFGLNSLEIPAYGFLYSLTPTPPFFPFLLAVRICEVRGCSPGAPPPHRPAPLPGGRNSPRKSP